MGQPVSGVACKWGGSSGSQGGLPLGGGLSGYKFCLQLEAGLVFWLSLLSVGKGKKLEKLSLVLETMSLGSLVSAKQKLVDF